MTFRITNPWTVRELVGILTISSPSPHWTEEETEAQGQGEASCSRPCIKSVRTQGSSCFLPRVQPAFSSPCCSQLISCTLCPSQSFAEYLEGGRGHQPKEGIHWELEEGRSLHGALGSPAEGCSRRVFPQQVDPCQTNPSSTASAGFTRCVVFSSHTNTRCVVLS